MRICECATVFCIHKYSFCRCDASSPVRTVEFILRYEASRTVRPYTVVRPYRVFESRLWADCSLTADVSARTRTVRLYSRTAEQLRNDSYSCTVDLGILADVHAAVHSAAARFVMILCMQSCFATDSDSYCCCGHGCWILGLWR